MTASERKRREWIAMLSVLVAPMDDTKATTALVKMLPMFKDFPDAAFTTVSCEHIAGLCKRVPGYSDLREKLWDWWKDHRPEPAPHYALEETKRAADESARKEANRASWNDPEAIRASVRSVLAVTEGQSPDLVKLRLGKMLGKAVAVNAPHHLHNVPPDWHPTAEELL